MKNGILSPRRDKASRARHCAKLEPSDNPTWTCLDWICIPSCLWRDRDRRGIECAVEIAWYACRSRGTRIRTRWCNPFGIIVKHSIVSPIIDIAIRDISFSLPVYNKEAQYRFFRVVVTYTSSCNCNSSEAFAGIEDGGCGCETKAQGEPCDEENEAVSSSGASLCFPDFEVCYYISIWHYFRTNGFLTNLWFHFDVQLLNVQVHSDTRTVYICHVLYTRPKANTTWFNKSVFLSKKQARMLCTLFFLPVIQLVKSGVVVTVSIQTCYCTWQVIVGGGIKCSREAVQIVHVFYWTAPFSWMKLRCRAAFPTREHRQFAH